MTSLRALGAAAAVSLAARSATAQIPNASAAATAMAGNYIAAADGYNAVAWNPAMLGMDGPIFSINLLTAGAVGGLNPVKLNDISPFYGKVIPASTKEQWLNAIGGGTERGNGDLGVSVVALNIWRVGFQVGASGSGSANLNQDAVEAILYGNAGRNNGTPKDLSLNGSRISSSTFAIGAASIAVPIPISLTGQEDEHFSIGITGKYVRGVTAVRGQDDSSLVTKDNILVRFPVIHTPFPDQWQDLFKNDHGSGMGLDVGLAWSAGNTTVSATARNVINNFKWKTAGLQTRLGTASFDGTNQHTSFDTTAYANAPLAMRTALEAEKFQPEFAAGIAHRMSRLLLTVDAGGRMSDGIDTGPLSHIGVGAELRILPLIPLRAGFTALKDGFQSAGGLGINIGPLEIGAAISLRSTKTATEYGGMVSLLTLR